MRTQKDWEIEAREFLKREIAANNVSYRDLSERLAAIGIGATEGALRVKIMRGRFTAAFMFQCLAAIQSEQFVSRSES